MRRFYWLLPLLASMLLACNKAPESKLTTAPTNPEAQPPAIPDFPAPTKVKPN
ncbi:MAG TPA: hypothetical protein VGZ47_17930 [Gemmataceae bacterium]|jgi:hypothetical protein|nr:hypothetical protein [Gemmataceae bacterium]